VTHRNVTVRLTRSGERWVRKQHPWLYASAIRAQSGEAASGDLAVIFDRDRKLLALGLYDPDSPIRIRVLHRGGPRPIDRAFFAERLSAAAALRVPLAAEDTTGYRLVSGENDGLPGLVLDRYAGTLVLKLYTAAWLPHLDEVLAAIGESLAPERVVLRLSRGIARRCEEHGFADGALLVGAPLDGPVLFRECGLTFRCDPVHGQKTGFFLDQRENRCRVGARAGGKQVLNAFSYTGGFSLHAARGGARSVVSLDASAIALDEARANFALNQSDPRVAACAHEVIHGDAFETLAQLAKAGRRFELAVIDPPALAKTTQEVPGALRAYARLAELGARLLTRGGELVFASCSSRIDADTLAAAMNEGAARAGRKLAELERTGHALDHPVTFPEGAYLKCIYSQSD
jgi:23S rRNA (cytosine1962-C5)-methyltransferase